MRKPLTKDDVISHKKSSIKKLNNLLEKYINDPTGSHLKKADLISYWLNSYCDYLNREETFDSTRLISYKRGDIIKADFGFNVGSEHGGLHYAVVLNVNNMHSSPVVTVIPLSSGTESDVHGRDVYLGNELYTKMLSKHKILFDNACEKNLENNKIIDAIRSSFSSEDKSRENLKQLLSELEEKRSELEDDLLLLSKYKMEIERMKQGSIAMMEQITTISKMRIYVPKKSRDILYGISFSSHAMDKINLQLKNLFLPDKN